jgi:Skp family chaperone for outer membrane proteins
MASRAADRLYSLPLEEFTKARNELVRELRKAGKREAADEVAALRKPNLVAWTANQLARRQPEDVRELIRVAKELRRGQRDVLSGRGRERLEEAMRGQREVVHRLLDAARDVLEERGSAGTITRVATTLRAAAATEATAKELAAGRLTEELAESGFGPLLHEVPPRPTKKRPAAAKARRDQRKAELTALRARLREAKAALTEERKTLRRAEREADRARQHADDAATRVTEAEQRVSELEAELKRRDR